MLQCPGEKLAQVFLTAAFLSLCSTHNTNSSSCFPPLLLILTTVLNPTLSRLPLLCQVYIRQGCDFPTLQSSPSLPCICTNASISLPPPPPPRSRVFIPSGDSKVVLSTCFKWELHSEVSASTHFTWAIKSPSLSPSCLVKYKSFLHIRLWGLLEIIFKNYLAK